jgi:site-specific DNA-methyltransferase (adenine-specific)/site-specific DNA-methyltransferase (cytosine-N4-specific)
MTTTILLGDVLDGLVQINDGSVQTCVTSPPYFGLRDYGVDGQIGAEPTPEEFITKLVSVFREVRRTLRDDGTLWLNIGDSYAGNATGGFRPGSGRADGKIDDRAQRNRNGVRCPAGCQPKDLIGIPWMLAFALRADGWHLRADITWAKPNPMPEPAKDRPTRSHEHLFLLTKSSQYFYDHEAAREPTVDGSGTRNFRDVWTIAPKPFKGAHFAVMPPELADRCIQAGSRPGDLVLDPFMGSGTIGLVANSLDREAVGCELNAAYAEISRKRLRDAGQQAEIYDVADDWMLAA